jgi:hypothetical protein
MNNEPIQDKSKVSSNELTEQAVEFNNDLFLPVQKLESINLQKNRTGRLTLVIRRHQQSFLYEQMQTLSDEEKLEFLRDHLISLQEAAYELRERELATAKVKELVLQEIEKLNKIDVDKFRSSGEIGPSTLQKKELSRFEKTAMKLKGLNMPNDAIINVLKGLGCNEVKAQEIINSL